MSPEESNVEVSLKEKFLSGKLTQVDIVGIQRELRQLWQSAEEGGEADNKLAVARSCILNLILYCSRREAELQAGDLLDEITLTHPCRAIMAVALADESPSLEAWVSARCHLPIPGATKQICCEQITVRSQGQGIHELPSVVLPLTLADLPVFLWWRQEELDRAHLEPFVYAIDRIIVDSLQWNNPMKDFVELAKCVMMYSHQVDFADLNWRRIVPWREAIAAAFDSSFVDVSVSDLSHLQAVELEYAVSSPSQAMLLTAWLAGRLNLTPNLVESQEDGMVLKLLSEQGSVDVNFRALDEPTVASGMLLNVKMTLSDERSLRFQLRNWQTKPLLVGRLYKKETFVKEVFSNGPEQLESKLIRHELDIVNHESIFEESVPIIARIATMSHSE